jgi:alpha-1,2-mannosyltransferase
LDGEQTRMSGQWYTSPRFRAVALWLAAISVVGFGIDAIFLRDNDFLWHCDVGRAFLRADNVTLAAGASWYPLGRRMMDVMLVAVPYRLSRAIVYLLSLAFLGVAMQLWRRMANAEERLDPARAFAAGALSLVFLAPHLQRDLQECGLQIILLAMLSAAAYALWMGRSIWAGFWLALAVSYKTTPALFLPVLLWKRQWRAAMASVVFIVILNVSPALYLGWDLTTRAYRQSWDFFQYSGRLEDIAENGIELPNPRNQSLMSFFARYLQSYPPEHSLYLDHPAFLQFGHLDHATARAVAKGCMLLLVGFIAWRLWGRWSERSPHLLAEWSAVCVLAALVSPMCWRQHLVLALPALYLLIWSLLSRPGNARAGWALLGGSVFVLWAPQSEVIGSLWASVLMAYKPDTVIFVAWAVVLLTWTRRGAARLALPAVPPVPEVQRVRAA